MLPVKAFHDSGGPYKLLSNIDLASHHRGKEALPTTHLLASTRKGTQHCITTRGLAAVHAEAASAYSLQHDPPRRVLRPHRERVLRSLFITTACRSTPAPGTSIGHFRAKTSPTSSVNPAWISVKSDKAHRRYSSIMPASRPTWTPDTTINHARGHPLYSLTLCQDDGGTSRAKKQFHVRKITSSIQCSALPYSSPRVGVQPSACRQVSAAS